jgi:hypothetical protein
MRTARGAPAPQCRFSDRPLRYRVRVDFRTARQYSSAEEKRSIAIYLAQIERYLEQRS